MPLTSPSREISMRNAGPQRSLSRSKNSVYLMLARVKRSPSFVTKEARISSGADSITSSK